MKNEPNLDVLLVAVLYSEVNLSIYICTSIYIYYTIYMKYEVYKLMVRLT
jgi:hypothetical protein